MAIAAIVIIAVVLAIVGAAILGRWFSGVPPIGSSYSATIWVESASSQCTYQGESPTAAYWFVVSVTVNNTGINPFEPSGLSWRLASTDGSRVATAAQQFYASRVVLPGQAGAFTLVFDLNSTFWGPAKAILTMPDGSETTGVLSVPQRLIDILFGVTQDGTNWSLVFVSVPVCLTTSMTTLTIVDGNGATDLAATSLSSLTYGTNQVAYSQYAPSSSVSVGDRLLISTARYGPSGYVYTISDSTTTLATGTLAWPP